MEETARMIPILDKGRVRWLLGIQAELLSRELNIWVCSSGVLGFKYKFESQYLYGIYFWFRSCSDQGALPCDGSSFPFFFFLSFFGPHSQPTNNSAKEMKRTQRRHDWFGGTEWAGCPPTTSTHSPSPSRKGSVRAEEEVKMGRKPNRSFLLSGSWKPDFPPDCVLGMGYSSTPLPTNTDCFVRYRSRGDLCSPLLVWALGGSKTAKKKKNGYVVYLVK